MSLVILLFVSCQGQNVKFSIFNYGICYVNRNVLLLLDILLTIHSSALLLYYKVHKDL